MGKSTEVLEGINIHYGHYTLLDKHHTITKDLKYSSITMQFLAYLKIVGKQTLISGSQTLRSPIFCDNHAKR